MQYRVYVENDVSVKRAAGRIPIFATGRQLLVFAFGESGAKKSLSGRTPKLDAYLRKRFLLEK